MKKYIDLIVQAASISESEAWWLLQHITNKNKAELLLGHKLTTQEQHALNDAIKLLTHKYKPLSYILGFVPFLNLKIQVQPPILIPRHETEEWVEKIINAYGSKKNEIKTILDIGTGSGCIALALASHFPNAHVTAIDINPQALTLAAQNAQLNNIENISFLQSNLFESINKNQHFDLIVSNPPYIDSEKLNSLPKQVAQWEDHHALFTADHGLEIIKQILTIAPQFLTKNDLSHQLIIEIDQDQKDLIIDFASKINWLIQPQKDSFGNWRTLWCTK